MVTALAYLFCVFVVILTAASGIWLVAIPATLGALTSIYICQHRKSGDRPRVNGLPRRPVAARAAGVPRG